MKRWIAIAAASLAAIAIGCGDSSSTTAVDDDDAAVEAAIRTWLLEGDCGVMTDKFLEAQTFESDPEVACERFEALFETPQYSEDDIEITDVEIDGERASAVVGGGGAGITSTYKLVREDGVWKIDAASLN